MGTFFDEAEYADQVEQAVASLEASPEPVQEESELDLADVDTRLETADYYRAILQHQFFDVKSEASVVVDREIRAFIKERLEVLLGIRSPKASAAQQFTPEEAQALKSIANVETVTALDAVAKKVMGKAGASLVQPAAPAPVVKKMPPPAAKPAKIPPARAKPVVKQIQPPAAKAKVVPEIKQPAPTPQIKKAEKKAIDGESQTYVNSEGNEVTLVEGAIIEEEGRRYRVVMNERGTLYRRDITGQVTGNVKRPVMTRQQMELESRMAAEQHVATMGEAAGFALLGSLAKE